MENGGLRRRIALMRQSLFDEGILDGHFARLEQVYRNHPFLEEYVRGYLRSSTSMLARAEQQMNIAPTDFSKVDDILDLLWRECYGIGLSKVRKEIKKTRVLLREGNLERAKIAFQDVRNEHDILKTKIEPYFDQRRLQARQTAPPPGEAITPRQ